MADGQHKLSRRALLGAACAAPALSRHPGLDPGSTFFAAHDGKGRWIPDQVRDDESVESFVVTKWDRALARYRRAEAALDALAGLDDDNLYDRVLGRFNKALSRLLRTPAPHPEALAEKLDLLVAHQAWELNFAEPAFAALRRDARRFAAGRPLTPSPARCTPAASCASP